MIRFASFFLVILLVNCSSSTPENSEIEEVEEEFELLSYEGLNLDKIKLPDGFKIDVFARVNNARSMVLSENGTLFVSNRGGDKVYAVRDTDGDWKADERYVIAEGMRMPNGIALKDGFRIKFKLIKITRLHDFVLVGLTFQTSRTTIK